MNSRLDRLTAILIDAVIKNYSNIDVYCAARSLERNGVSLETALRILTRPWMRRQLPTKSILSFRALGLQNGAD